VPGARAEVVQLDAVVTDAKGTVVRDLTQADFQILEDGKPQAVSQFFVVTLGAGAYELRVVVQDGKAGATAFRKVPFTID
jgi:hypothetical protein